VRGRKTGDVRVGQVTRQRVGCDCSGILKRARWIQRVKMQLNLDRPTNHDASARYQEELNAAKEYAYVYALICETTEIGQTHWRGWTT